MEFDENGRQTMNDMADITEVKQHSERVIALKFLILGAHNDSTAKLCLAEGSGQFLNIYDPVEAHPCIVDSIQALHGSLVHGIVQKGQSHLIAVYGQKSVAVFKLNISGVVGEPSCYKLTHYGNYLQYDFNDLIWDLIWCDNSNCFYIVTAHNCLHLVDAEDGHTKCSIAGPVNCILYSAKFLHNNQPVTGDISSVCIAAGTVFNQVIIWQPNHSTGTPSEVIHRLKGHKGVIFSIDVNYKRRCLASVSDDRTARVWSWTEPENGSGESLASTWKDREFELLCVCEGHTARVWRSILFSDCLFTIGEDSQIICWDYSGNLLKRTSAHRGKNIWSIASHGESNIATGGADCSVKLWRCSHLRPDQSQNTFIELSHEFNQSDDRTEDFPRDLCLIDQWCVWVTNEGRVLTSDCLGDFKSGPVCLYQSDHLKGYCILRSSAIDGLYSNYSLPDTAKSHLLVINNEHGDVIMMKITVPSGQGNPAASNSSTHKLSPRKIISICLMKHEMNLFLLISELTGFMKLFVLNLESNEPAVPKPLCRLLIPKVKQRYVEHACIVAKREFIILVCGDRSGSVHTFHLANVSTLASGELAQVPLEPTQTLSKLHGEGGITQIVYCATSEILYTVGRDGLIRKYCVDGILRLQTKQRIDSNVEWLSGLHSSPVDSKMMYTALFHTTDFILWDSYLEQPVISVNCGGGYRNWDLRLFKDTNGEVACSFVFIKDKGVYSTTRIIKPPYQLLKPMYHGAKITSSLSFRTDNRHYLLTCSDNSTLLVSELQERAKPGSSLTDSVHRLAPIQQLQGHIGNIKCCCHVVTGRGHFLFTAGGRAQLCGWHITSSSTGDLVYRILGSVRVSDRFTSLAQRRRTKGNDDSVEDPDIRVMSIQCAVDVVQTELFYIIAACSDGCIRLILYNDSVGKMSVLKAPKYTHSHCLLVSLSFQNTDRPDSMALAVSATNGTIMLFEWRDLTNSDQLATPYQTYHHLHQSGINAMSVVYLSHDRVLLADEPRENSRASLVTGGDDNAVIFMRIDNSRSVTGRCAQKLDTLHSAQVTGIVQWKDLVVSASIDQRVVIYSYCHKEWKPLKSIYITVSDVSSMVTINDMLVVAGEGFTLIGPTFTKPNNRLPERSKPQSYTAIVSSHLQIS